MISCALIGCGYWGSKLKGYIEQCRGLNLRCVCNSKSNLHEVWDDEQITAVVVATPNDTHYPITRTALLCGKHVLVEKPLALKTHECEELRQIALDNDRVLLVDYTWTFSKGLAKAQSLVQEGEIGKLLGAHMVMGRPKRPSRGNVYWLLGSHLLSVLDLFVPIEELSFERADLVTHDGEVETGIISFVNDDISGQILVSLNCPGRDTRVTLYGECGVVMFRPEQQPSLRIAKADFRIDEAHNLRHAIQHFHESLMGRAAGNADRAVAVTRILETLTGG